MTQHNVPLPIITGMVLLFLAAGTMQTVLLKWSDHLSSADKLESRYYGQRTSGFLSQTPSSPVALLTKSQTQLLEQSTTADAYYTSLQFVYSFGHPFVQTFFMFCGECVCLLIFISIILYVLFANSVKLDRQDSIVSKLIPGKHISLPCNPCAWILTAGADFVGSIMQNAGLLLTTASVYQMLRGATVLWVALISFVWFKRRYSKVELWGIFIVFLGLTVVGLSSFVNGPKTSSTTDKSNTSVSTTTTKASEYHSSMDALLGNMLIVLAQVSHAYQGVCQERLITLYKVPPLQMVGMEGFYGAQMTIMLLAVQLFIPLSHWSNNIVSIRESIHRYTTTMYATSPSTNNSVAPNITVIPITQTMSTTYTDDLSSILSNLSSSSRNVPYDDVILAFSQMSVTMSCTMCIVAYIVSCVVYNVTLMFLIKHLNVVATVMIGSLRNISVWIVCLSIPSVFHESFDYIQLIGFLLLVAGNVLYQRICISRFDQVLPQRMIDACPWLFHDAQPRLADDHNSATVELQQYYGAADKAS